MREKARALNESFNQDEQDVEQSKMDEHLILASRSIMNRRRVQQWLYTPPGGPPSRLEVIHEVEANLPRRTIGGKEVIHLDGRDFTRCMLYRPYPERIFDTHISTVYDYEKISNEGADLIPDIVHNDISINKAVTSLTHKGHRYKPVRTHVDR